MWRKEGERENGDRDRQTDGEITGVPIIMPCGIWSGEQCVDTARRKCRGCAADFRIAELLRDSKSTHIDPLPSGCVSQTHSGLWVLTERRNCGARGGVLPQYILYTWVNSNEHFHAIKLKELLVIKKARGACAGSERWAEGGRKEGRDNKFLHSFNHC